MGIPDIEIGKIKTRLMEIDKKVVFVYLDDWLGIYIDNKCVYQDHSIRPNQLLDLIGIKNEEYWIDDYEPNLRVLPENLKDLKLD